MRYAYKDEIDNPMKMQVLIEDQYYLVWIKHMNKKTNKVNREGEK